MLMLKDRDYTNASSSAGLGPKGQEAATGQSARSSAAPSFLISLPKGGGAIRGIGEKFAANPVTGTGSMAVPIATSPGRSGLARNCRSLTIRELAMGHSALGWNLSIPSITRKTDKGLPRYRRQTKQDVFILSGAEDLVPVLVRDTARPLGPDGVAPRTVDGSIYRVDQRYRPRIEGLFARIERWTNQADPKDSFWRSISKEQHHHLVRQDHREPDC